MKKILILNGPNLDRLGAREPEIYGTQTMSDCLEALAELFPSCEIVYFQSNHEGALIDRLWQANDEGFFGVAFNAGAFTHTSVALLDAIRGIEIPVVEVHLSNVHQREDFRHKSLISAGCEGVIAGFGMQSYRLAVQALLARKG